MNFAKVPDFLPRPLDYLRAGLARPTQAVGSDRSSWAENSVGSDSQVMDFLTSARGAGARGPQTLTLTDGSGALSGVVWAPSTQYLTYPAPLEVPKGEVAQASRSLSGVLHIDTSTRGPEGIVHEPPPVDPDTARIVTVDLSVLLAQIDPAKFAINEALYISSALAIELAVTTGTEPWSEGTVRGYTKPYEWPWSTPVPIDDLVLYVYSNLALNVHPGLRTTTVLDRTDLLCAATAIAYDTPMYTTKPEAYKGLKNGLKVLKYGPTRNKGTVVGSPGAAKVGSEKPVRRFATATSAGQADPPPPTPTPRLSGAQELRRAYDDGEEFGARAERMLTRATEDPEELASTLCDILDDHSHNSDPAWRIALLERAEKLAPALRKVENGHQDLLTAVSSLVSAGQSPDADPALARQSAAALAAYGTWGRWPEDIISDVLVGIGDREPEDLAWYRTFLKIAGAPDAVIDAEMDAIIDGRTDPSAERLEQFRSTTR